MYLLLGGEPQQSESFVFWFERGVSRVRSVFAKRMKFFEAKYVDTFNANDSRNSPHLQILLTRTKNSPQNIQIKPTFGEFF